MALFIEHNPYLRANPDYLEFLEGFGGGQIAPVGKAEAQGGFLFATLYGLGEFEFADEAPAVTPDGFYVFALIEVVFPDTADPSFPAGQRAVASFAFDTTGRRPNKVFAEVHNFLADDSPFTIYCATFADWLQALVKKEGWLLKRDHNGRLVLETVR